MVKNEFYNFRHVYLARYDAFGNSDTSFANNGFSIIEFSQTNGELNNVIIQPDGHILFIGRELTYVTTSQTALNLIRFKPDGALDESFATNGKFSSILPTKYFQSDKALYRIMETF